MSSTDLVMGAAGGAGGAPATYVEDVFSTYLYTGNGSTQTINNGIDLAGEGGLNWIKSRSNTGFDHNLTDTARGVQQTLATNTTAGQFNYSGGVTAFTSSGFTVADGNYTNANAATYASWTFRKHPKFFDVITYTGNGANSRQLDTALSGISNIGFAIVKRIDGTSDWWAQHIDAPFGNTGKLNSSSAWSSYGGALTYALLLNTSSAGNSAKGSLCVNYAGYGTALNVSGATYVAYVFAHDAGGFGTSGTDNVISCGSFTTDSSGNATVNLGYEPQYILCKYSSSASSWYVFDTMRGLSLTQQRALFPNQSYAESGYSGTGLFPTATGFSTLGTSLFDPNVTLIYMAIRRPMKVPTDATTVFKPVAWTGTGTNPQRNTAGFPVDMIWDAPRVLASGFEVKARLIGTSNYLLPSGTSAESSNARIAVDNNVGVDYGNASGSWWNQSDRIMASHYFRRALGFFDVVCYTGNNTERTINHNLGVAPELMIVKNRTNSGFNWEVWSAYTNVTAPYGHDTLKLNLTNAAGATGYFPTDPTSSVFTVSSNNQVNQSSANFVSYLFATCPGVSKVGTFSHDGVNPITVNCGFTSGARFVLIKAYSTSGDWYVFDTARGIISANDPALTLNSTSAEITNGDFIDPSSSGFIATANIAAGDYLYLAIA